VRVSHTVTRVFGAVHAESGWTPALNCYESAGMLHVCVELAGVDRETIHVSVEPGRLTIRGYRATPEPPTDTAKRIHCMEIDAGPFERTLALPQGVDLDAVSSRYRDGLLWIELPLDA
jgi:HSP20 family protein